MEKPSNFDYAMRIRTRSMADRDAARMAYDRMMFKDTLQKVTSDEEEKPTWRGDHSFSPEAAAYSLSNFIEPEVKKAHPTWSEEAIHEEAVTRFQKRLEQDLKYEHKENAHEETVVQWEVVEISPGIKELATKYGDDYITLQALWDHTKEFAETTHSPNSYNGEEAKAQLAMQDAFINGEATGFVSVLSHPDAIRYVQVWEKTEEGDIVSKQIDLFSTTGRDFTTEESVQLIEHFASFQGSSTPTVHLEEKSTYAHYFVRSGESIRESDIKTIAIAQSFVREEIRGEHIQREVIQQSMVGRISSDTIETTKEMVGQFRMFLEHKLHPKKEQAQEENGKIQKKEHHLQKSATAEKQPSPKHVLQPTSPSAEDRQINLPKETPKSELVMKRATHIAVGPIAFLTLSTQEKRQEHVQVAVKREKQTEPSAQKEPIQTNHISVDVISLWRTIVSNMLSQTDSRVNVPSGEPHPTLSKKEKTIKTKDVSTSPVSEKKLLEILRVLSEFFRVKESEQSEAFHKPREMKLRNISMPDYFPILTSERRENLFEVMVKRLEQHTKRLSLPDMPIERTGEPEELKQLGELVFTYVYWILTHTGESPVQPIMERSIGTKDYQSEQTSAPSDETPWILWAIIYQLAMIREMGKSTGQTGQNNGKAKKKKGIQNGLSPVSPFPDHGIIFLAVLHDRMNYIAATTAVNRVFSYG